MHQKSRRGALVRYAKVAVIAATVASSLMARNATAQDRLKSMPGYDQYQRMARALPTPLRLSGIATGNSIRPSRPTASSRCSTAIGISG